MEEEDEEEDNEEEDHEEKNDEEEDPDKALRDTDDPLPYCGGEAWQGDPVEGMGASNQKNTTPKKGNKKKENETLSYDIFDNDHEDASIFASINGDDFKKEVAKNVKLSMKTNTVDIFITRTFCNTKTGKSIWIAVFGDYGLAWTLLSQFIKGYIVTLLKKSRCQTLTLVTQVCIMTSTFASMNTVKRVYGSIKSG